MDRIYFVVKRTGRAIGIAVIHVTLFVVLHGVITHVAAGSMPKIFDDALEMFSEAIVYTAIPG